MFKSIIYFIVLLSTQFAIGQDCFCGKTNFTEGGILDGFYPKENVATKQLIPYTYVREADVIWSKRVWSFIDVREKINHPLFYPLDEITPNGTLIKRNDRVSLWTILRCNVLAGNVQAFSPYNVNNLFGNYDGDQLKYPLEPGVAGGTFYTDSSYRESLTSYMGTLGPQSDIPIVDEYGDPIVITLSNGDKTFKYEARDTIWYASKDIVEWRIKEDWFFDKNRSSLDRRIIAIAPVVLKKEMNANGVEVIVGTKELFWVYFPHLRYVLNNYNVYNKHNDSQWMSYDDLFWKRMFNAVIYKESNMADRAIETYSNGVEALLESERIKEKIRTLESDVWQF
jgi:gliding motility associated protien GldN